MPYVYILRCKDNSLYTGWTTDIDRRVKEHNSGKGAKYTRARRPVKLAYYEEHNNKSNAAKREYEIKQFSKKKKEELVKGFNTNDK
ncbi:GIY-YIG nuclease family protein [Dethiothermospora halolimnae]|uniref:GIY-YIG nuclease family protein n=1 Tax=Dethiothermospora halolimnae TaxID=3114390 RepID=UPI003CCBF49B